MAFLRLGVEQFADALAWLHKNGISQQGSMCCLHVTAQIVLPQDMQCWRCMQRSQWYADKLVIWQASCV